jgi:hypothetical protein
MPPVSGQAAGAASSPEQKKAPGVTARGFDSLNDFRSDDLDLISLHALLTLHGDEADALAFLKGLETRALDGAEMHEQVGTAFRRDEAETLGIVEPLDGTGLTIRHDLTP